MKDVLEAVAWFCAANFLLGFLAAALIWTAHLPLRVMCWWRARTAMHRALEERRKAWRKGGSNGRKG